MNSDMQNVDLLESVAVDDLNMNAIDLEAQMNLFVDVSQTLSRNAVKNRNWRFREKERTGVDPSNLSRTHRKVSTKSLPKSGRERTAKHRLKEKELQRLFENIRETLRSNDPDLCFPPTLDANHIHSLKNMYSTKLKSESHEFPCFCCGQLCRTTDLIHRDINSDDFTKLTKLLQAPDFAAATINLSHTIFQKKFGMKTVYANAIKSLFCEPRAIKSNGKVAFCNTCTNSLLKEEIPKFALKNDLWTGEIPDELTDLSLVERMLICRTRLVCYIQTLRHGFKKATGSLSIFVQNTKQIAKLLPHALSSVDDTIRVCFDRTLIESDLIPVRRMFVVRKEKVLNALTWLKAHNPHYCDIEIDFSTDLPDNESFADKYLSSVEINTDNIAPINTEQAIDAVTRTGFIDLTGNFRAVSDDVDAALTNLQSLMIVPGDAVPLFSYPNLMELSYPHLFPFGSGGYAHTKLTFPDHTKALLHHASRRFSRDESFLFAVFNYYCRKKVSNTAKYKYTSSHYTEENLQLLKLTPKNFEDLIKNPNKIDDAAAQTLLKRLKIITAGLPGSAQNKSDLRRSLRWLTAVRGGPSFWLTINPADVHSPIVQLKTGHMTDLTDSLPQREQRETNLLNDPVAAADFYHSVFQNVIKYLIEGGDKLADRAYGGVFGPVDSYAGVIEEQGRKSLHLHMLIWCTGANQKKIAELVENKDYEERLCNYLDDVVATTAAGLYWNGSERFPEISCPFCSKSIENESAKQKIHFTLPNHTCIVLDQDRPSEYLRSLANNTTITAHPSTKLFPVENQNDTLELVASSQIHQHSFTCFKNNRQRCRMRLGQPLQDQSDFDEKGNFISQRDHPYIVSYNKHILEATRCNICCTTLLGTSERNHLQLSLYMSDYATKRTTTISDTKDMCRIAIETLKNGTHQTSTQLLNACLKRITASEELGAAMVAYYTLGYDDFLTSESFEYLNISEFLAYLSWQNDSESNVVARSLFVHQGKLHVQNNLQNYMTRDNEYETLSVYEYFWQKKKKRKKDCILVCTGAPIPHPNKQSEDFAKYCLALFVPWRQYAAIRPKPTFMQTWKNIKSTLSNQMKIIVGNLTTIFGDRSPPDDAGDLKEDANDLQLDDTESIYSFTNDMVPNTDDLYESYNQLNEGSLDKTLSSMDRQYLNAIVATWKQRNSEYLAKIVSSLADYVNITKSIHRQLKLALTQQSEFLPSTNPNTITEPLLIHLPTLQNLATQIAATFQLTGRQLLSYKIFIAKTISANITFRQAAYSMFVTGFGGVGKSHLIKAVQTFYSNAIQYDTTCGLLVTATTGSAAALIDGVTIDSALSLHTKTPELPTLRAKFASITHLIIDECSMLGAEKLHQIDFICKLAKNNEDEDFGGIVVMLTGDLKQLPPVLQVPLYRNPTALSTKHAETKRRQLAGLLLFKAITFTIILRRQHRIQTAPEYESLLINLRQGFLSTADLNLLESRKITSLSTFTPADVSNFIFTSNAMRTAVNEMIVSKLDSTISLTSVAVDQLQGQKRVKLPSNIPTVRALYDRLQLLDDAPKRPRYHQHIVIGMCVTIKQNLFPELNIVNGTIGIVNSIPPPLKGQTIPCNQIPWIAVEFPHLPADRRILPEFPPQVIPIAPATTQFEYEGLKFTRKQFPITPAYAMTIHGAQGRSLAGQTVVQLLPSMSIQEVYVELSRMPSQNQLLIMDSIPTTFKPWPKDLLSFLDTHLMPAHTRTLSDPRVISLIDNQMKPDLDAELALDVIQKY